MNTARTFPTIAKLAHRRYRAPVAANSATGFDGPNTSRRTSADHTTAGAFFVPVVQRYGGCYVWGTFGCAGFLESRSVNPCVTAATPIRLTANRGSSSTLGAVPMNNARNPSTPNSHADAYKAMALAALRADSSLTVRLNRYNAAMARARALEAAGGAE